MKLNKEIKKALVEAKEQKERRLIEESLIKSKIMMICESEENIKNFDSLTKTKQRKIANAILTEIILSDDELLNEGLWDAITSLFGSSFSGLAQMIGEPIVNSILGALGMEDGYFKSVMISFFTKNWGRLAKALRGDCKELTGLVAESLVEGMVIQLANSKGMTGAGYTFLRNTLEDAIHSTSFIQGLENSLESTVCGLLNKFTGKATEVASKLKAEPALAAS
jgi:chemotaxis protein CheY-P-specific phosphatase CheC